MNDRNAGSMNGIGAVSLGGLLLGGLVMPQAAVGQIFPDTMAAYRDLHNFSTQGGDAEMPRSDLVADSQGRLYGTSNGGGAFGEGALFRLTLPKTSTGAAKVEILHSFQTLEGRIPEGGVLLGADGGIYGSTNSGGANNAGTIFRIDSKSFALTKLHDFNPSVMDGSAAIGGLTAGPNGLIYGTTTLGGAFGEGTVFAISPKGDAVSYAVIHSFGSPGDGTGPYLGRLLSSGSTLFGMTQSDTMHGFGTAFEMTLGAGGWSESIIHQFGSTSADFMRPANGLVMDGRGTLYGCASGGQFGHGGVFTLTPLGGGAFSEAAIKNFGTHPNEPIVAECALVMDDTGRLIGTTSDGGKFNAGTIFALTPGSGGYRFTVSHNFQQSGSGAYEPDNSLFPAPNGQFVGTLVHGGTFAQGALFTITP